MRFTNAFGSTVLSHYVALLTFFLPCAHCGDQFLECGGTCGLADQVSEPSPPDVVGDRRVSACSMGNKRRVARPCLFFQHGGGLVTIDPRRHVEVENDQLGCKRGGDMDRLLAALRQTNLASELLKCYPKRLRPIMMIVDNQILRGSVCSINSTRSNNDVAGRIGS